jgi:hypothetical protein
VSPRLLYLLTAGRRRENVAVLRGFCRGLSPRDSRIPYADWSDLTAAEVRGYGLRAVPDAAIRRGA